LRFSEGFERFSSVFEKKIGSIQEGMLDSVLEIEKGLKPQQREIEQLSRQAAGISSAISTMADLRVQPSQGHKQVVDIDLVKQLLSPASNDAIRQY
jgi:hypothetical protein